MAKDISKTGFEKEPDELVDLNLLNEDQKRCFTEVINGLKTKEDIPIKKQQAQISIL